MWSFTVHDTITGARTRAVEPSAGSWGRSPGAGRGAHTFQLNDADGLPGARALFMPNAASLAVAWNGAVLYAGVVGECTYSRDTGELTVPHVDVRALFSQRLTFGVGGYNDGDLAVSGKSLGGLVRAILKYGIGADGRGGPEWGLPLDLPADTAGPHSLDVKRWEWATIEDLLTRVERLGATIDFDPYYDSGGGLRYAVRVGTPLLPGVTSEYPIHADETPVSGLTYSLSGNRQLTGCFYMGMGTEADMKWGEAGFIPGPLIPVRDAARSAKDIDDVGKLNQMAMHDLVQHRGPLEEWSFSMVLDGSVSVAGLKPGGRLNLESRRDTYISDGWHSLVVTGLSGNMSFVVTPEVQPI